MTLHFHKYQATGNDFILIDNRSGSVALTTEQVRKLCDRRLGIGADGLMLIEKDPSLSFNLLYYNSDGTQSLCGNGSRAAMHFASSLGLVQNEAKFNAYDGSHEAHILHSGLIRLKMNNVTEVRAFASDLYLNTGSPHYIRFVEHVENYPVTEEGRKIRNSDSFTPDGTNVNFVELQGDNTIFVRTYERGVENETLSCGTGVTAAALASSLHGNNSPVTVNTRGGKLTVEFARTPTSNAFTDIFLVGPAIKVFEGRIEL